MSYTYLLYAVWYNRSWRMAVAFKAVTGVPLHEWRDYAETGMDTKTVAELFKKYVMPRDKKNVRLAVITGPYLKKIGVHHIVVDIDAPPIDSPEEKNRLLQQLSKDGYVVVNTPRGFHIHAVLTDPEPPYIVAVVREGEKREKIGEGGVLFPHPWTSPPSVRPLGENRWFRYAFVLPDGKRFARYDVDVLKKIEPPSMSFDELVADLETYLGARIRRFSPARNDASGAEIARRLAVDKSSLGRKRALYYNLEEFHERALNFPLPNCVAWILYNYYKGVGAVEAANIIASYCEYPYLTDLVPHGKRFLIAAAFTLFMAHIVEWVKFEEIVEILGYAIEDWPSDEGMNMDRKLQYLLYADDEDHVYPRYGGLGALSPQQVDPLLCETCFYYGVCQGRNPWRSYRRWLKRHHYAKMLFASRVVDEEVEG